MVKRWLVDGVPMTDEEVERFAGCDIIDAPEKLRDRGRKVELSPAGKEKLNAILEKLKKAGLSR